MKREVFEITLPLSTPLDEFLPRLREGLEGLLAS